MPRNSFDVRDKTVKKATGSPKVRSWSLAFEETKKKKIVHCKLDYMGYSRMCVLANLNF